MRHEIDLNKLSVEQLIELNADVVARVKYLRQKESYKALAKFNVGDRVSFQTNQGTVIKGHIVRLNKKTATLHADDHHHWNVAPQMLKKEAGKQTADLQNVLRFRNS